MNLKHSRQREAIKDFLMTRYDHPTADVVYSNLRMIISMAMLRLKVSMK